MSFWLILALGHGRALAATPPSDQLLPASTKACVSTPDYQTLRAAWRQTGLSRMLADPAMKPFLDRLGRTADGEAGAGRWFGDLLITADDLNTLATGAVTMALVDLGEGRMGNVVLVDAAGKDDLVRSLLSNAVARLMKKGATRTGRVVGSTTVHAFELAPAGEPARHTVCFFKDGTLAVANDFGLAEGILTNWSRSDGSTGAPDSLAQSEPYRMIVEQCRQPAGAPPPHLRWFADPIGLAHFGRPTADSTGRKEDPAVFWQKHGFDTIRGLGGHISLAAEGCDLIHHTVICAPKPYQHAMAMLETLPAKECVPPDWVPEGVNTYATLHLNLTTAFDNFAGLYDDLLADGKEGVFEDTIADMKADFGPGVDVRKDLVSHLGPRITVFEQPAESPDAEEHRIVAVETIDEPQVALAVKKLLRDDTEITRQRIEGLKNDLWLIGSNRNPQKPRTAVLVANGELFVADDLDLLRQVVRRSSGTEGLAETDDFQAVSTWHRGLEAEGTCLRAFVRLEQDVNETYELFRAGKAELDDSVYAQLLRWLSAMAVDGGADAQSSIDYTLLPPFGAVKKYLGTAGVYGRNLEDGWLLSGCILEPVEE